MCFNQVYDHLTANNLLIVNQSAYRKNHSCETALIKICNDTLSLLDSSTNVVIALLDFTAAFDTLHHELLINKLQYKYGLSSNVLKWFKSYLKDRVLRVKIGEFISNGKPMNFGVPQGSVLGPLLFCLYIQEINEIICNYDLRFHCFADDIQIYSPMTANDQQLQVIKDCLNKIKIWANQNSLKLNDSKTKFVEIKTRNSNISTTFNNTFVCDASAKNLGVTIDSNLYFSDQINNVCKRGFGLLRQLWRISYKLNNVSLKT